MTEIRKIILQFPSLRAFLAEYGERISTEGMLLRGEAPPAAGSTVDIEVVVAAGMRLLRARGEALWSGAAETGAGPPAAAIRFQELDQASRTLIDKIVEQRRREGAAPFILADVPGSREVRPRDLTVPAEPVLSAGTSADSIFDLVEPPAATVADLLSPVEGSETVPVSTPPAVVAEPTARREPAAPVPLLADQESTPFDLPSPEVAGGEEVAAPAQADLSDLFGGDEPEVAPASGRTEAFPPSFVDEVEAELEAAEITERSYLEVDTGELAVQFGGSLGEREGFGLEPDEQSIESALVAPVDVDPPAVPPVEAVPTATPPVEAEPLRELPPDPETPPSLQELSPQVAGAFGAAQGPETVEIPVLDPPPPVVPELAPEPPPVAETPPSVAPEEQPIVEPAPPAVLQPLVVDQPSTEAVSPPAIEVSPPAVTLPPPVEVPPAMDDNLLAIPELKVDSSAAEGHAAPEGPVDLPSSAQSLRGAASRSRHLGTWLLMALLVGALAVAGYFIMGLLRNGNEPLQPDISAAVTEPQVVISAPTPDETPAEVGEAPVGEEVEPATAEATEIGPAPAEPMPAEPAPPEPLVPLTGLDRITWSETDTETVLTIVADGEISRQSVELIPIAGSPPRLLIKISGVQRAFQPAVLEVGTSHVERVRTGLHAGGQLHIVVDLAAGGVLASDLAVSGARLEVRLGAE